MNNPSPVRSAEWLVPTAECRGPRVGECSCNEDSGKLCDLEERDGTVAHIVKMEWAF